MSTTEIFVNGLFIAFGMIVGSMLVAINIMLWCLVTEILGERKERRGLS